MDKFWLVYSTKNSGVLPHFKSEAEAVAEAKRLQAADHNSQFVVMESVSVTVKPVPLIEMKEMT